MARIFDSPLFTSDSSIDRVINAGLPAVVIFLDGQANGALDQELKRLAREQAGKLLFVYAPVKDNGDAARRFGVHNLPALVAFQDGRELVKTDSLAAADVEAYARFLLGQGPRPAARASAGVGTGAGNGRTNGPANRGQADQQGRSEAGGTPVTVTDRTFEQEVMRSSLPVVVDFWAPWCGPCRMVAPILDKLAREMSGRVKIAKVNVDENPMVGGQYGVQAIPTMMIVKDGKIVDRWAGALPEQAIRQRLAAVANETT